MAYKSRAYIAEKWREAKWDIEGVILANEDEDKISDEDAARVLYNVETCFGAILKELKK